MSMANAEGPVRDSTAGALKARVSDLGELVGASLGPTRWFEVTQQRIGGFADATDDWQWIHVDEARSDAGPYGGTIAHGYLTLSLVPKMLAEALTISDEVRGTNYGLGRLRFTNPVRSGSRIRLAGKLAEVERRPDGGVRYTVAAEVQIEGGDRPALVGEFLYLSYPEPV
jgi:acyl dehydratase